jgi:AcrR family transcriptional regulator
MLNRPVILEAARRLADTEGLGALTLRRLAHEVNTGQASLYRHITDRDELLGLLVDDFAESYPLESGRGGIEQRLLRQWKLTRDHLAAHRWVVRVAAEGRVDAFAAEGLGNHNRALLTAAGLSASQAAKAERALWNLTLGDLIDEQHHGSEYVWSLTRLVRGILG